MYHHHLITRDNKETIKKIYYKQKESNLKNYWYQTLKTDFEFIGEDIFEERISNFSKIEYSNHIKKKVEKAAFTLYTGKKETHKQKLGDIKYDTFKIQPYMNHKKFGKKEIKLMCLLRSNSYPDKMNYRKMFKNNLKCSFDCNRYETQIHIFEECSPISTKLSTPTIFKLNQIFGTLEDQCDIIGRLVEIDSIRKQMKDNLLPGGAPART